MELQAGNGIGAKKLSEVSLEYRGQSWSVGGDETLASVTTVPSSSAAFSFSRQSLSLVKRPGAKAANCELSLGQR